MLKTFFDQKRRNRDKFKFFDNKLKPLFQNWVSNESESFGISASLAEMHWTLVIRMVGSIVHVPTRQDCLKYKGIVIDLVEQVGQISPNSSGTWVRIQTRSF